ncbi:BNR-4 repeat-containing protein [Janibacter melonis]|uniref:BNR-4 repeat-containing protein n=1 Tax=Janibacter melonis TaxID=262209 RepID=UPI001749B42A|nr:BNR-4 repeat-containing protein [Janibacter melonis]
MRRRTTTMLVAVLGTALLGLAPAAPGRAAGPDPLPEPYMTRGDVARGALSSTRQPVVRARTVAPRRTATSTRTARVVTSSAWSWYMDPRVLGTSTATYLSSVRNNGDIQVTRVARGSAELSHAVLHARFQPDDHNAPSLTELPDGRIAAFWNGHAAVPARYRVTEQAGDVTTFGPTQRLVGSGLERDRVTYTVMLQLSEGAYRYHLFTRRAVDNAWMMTRSKDLVRWTPAVRLFDHPTRENAPYPKFVTDGRRTIHVAVSDTMATPTQLSSMYHLTLADGVFRRSDGSTIRTLSEVAGSGGAAPRPIDPREATLVYDGRSADGRARIYDIALDAAGRPALVLTTGDVATDMWTYKWFRLGAGGWAATTLDRAPGPQPSGITMRHDDPGRVFLVQGPGSVGERELVEYRTADEGQTWQRRPVTSGSTQGNRTPATPWGAQDGPVDVAWLAGPYTTFNNGLWDTTVTMSTSDPAPVDLTSTWPIGWARGKGITSTITEGVGGRGLPGVRARLMARLPGQPERAMSSRLTGADGSVHLAVNRYYPRGTRVRVDVPSAGGWGSATTTAAAVETDTTAIDLDSTWRTGWDRGVGVSASVTARRDGSPRAGTPAWLLVRKPGTDQQEFRTGSRLTDAAGSVHLPVNRYYPKGTRVRLHVPAQAPWGSATSSSHRTGS